MNLQGECFAKEAVSRVIFSGGLAAYLRGHRQIEEVDNILAAVRLVEGLGPKILLGKLLLSYSLGSIRQSGQYMSNLLVIARLIELFYLATVAV